MRFMLAAVVLVLVVGVLGVRKAEELLQPAAERPAPELFRVEAGESMSGIARRLQERGLLRSARATRWLARYEGLDGQLQVGEYELSPDQTPESILGMITTGRVKTWSLTIPEGSRAAEIAQRLEDQGLGEASAFIQAANDPEWAAALGVPGSSLEGYLYPDTYTLPRGLSEREITAIMVREFNRVWSERIAPLARQSGLSQNEIVTLASIVEKETAEPSERPLIAAVFLNRLDRGMRLETDPTVIYGIPDFDGNLTRAHLRDRNNPYNTYRIEALPPGPIANPGIEALQAVVEPAETRFLYFVSRNDGTHEFSATYREHEEAVTEYQRRRRSRQRANRQR
ncbi:MAG: endolytic transglycosylase MltG [Myxococcota bacterium]|nr:endolytic transglycosylase MltG [Myxococcota bacterium]